MFHRASNAFRGRLVDAFAVARQIERDNLNELIQVAEAEHGPVTDEEVQALRDQLHQARRGGTAGGANAA
ncbi:hypothetical protein [Streptomyces hebeiensis]